MAHTVVFVTVASVVGAVLAGAFSDRIDDRIESERFDASGPFAFLTAGFLAGGLSHVFADILSAPDLSRAIEPLWPVYSQPLGIDLVWYNAAWINVGFLSVMVVAHVAVAYLTTLMGHRYQLLPK